MSAPKSTPATNSYFITFEGGEGVGKSTQIKRLAERLEKIGLKVTISREPGGTKGAEAVRHVVLDKAAAESFGPSMEALLFAAAFCLPVVGLTGCGGGGDTSVGEKAFLEFPSRQLLGRLHERRWVDSIARPTRLEEEHLARIRIVRNPEELGVLGDQIPKRHDLALNWTPAWSSWSRSSVSSTRKWHR